MRLLREYIKELLTEAAMGPWQLPDSVHVVIETQTDTAKIFYAEEDGKPIVATRDFPWGEIFIVDITGREDTGPCGGAWKLSSANAGSGWGPMLYDVAMEYATVVGGGLIADRDTVSPDARSVWDYYLGNREDVGNSQMDNLKNVLTPDIEDDNCSQRVATYSMAGDLSMPKNVDWTKSSLSKRYTKEPTTMTALRSIGKLVEI